MTLNNLSCLIIANVIFATDDIRSTFTQVDTMSHLTGANICLLTSCGTRLWNVIVEPEIWVYENRHSHIISISLPVVCICSLLKPLWFNYTFNKSHEIHLYISILFFPEIWHNSNQLEDTYLMHGNGDMFFVSFGSININVCRHECNNTRY